MLNVLEEKQLYFTNHSWTEFQQVYDYRLKQLDFAILQIQKMEFPDMFRLDDLQTQRISTDLRRIKIGNIVANNCDVKFINVTSNLKSSGHF